MSVEPNEELTQLMTEEKKKGLYPPKSLEDKLIEVHCANQNCQGCPKEFDCDPKDEPDGTDDGDGWDPEYGYG